MFEKWEICHLSSQPAVVPRPLKTAFSKIDRKAPVLLVTLTIDFQYSRNQPADPANRTGSIQPRRSVRTFFFVIQLVLHRGLFDTSGKARAARVPCLLLFSFPMFSDERLIVLMFIVLSSVLQMAKRSLQIRVILVGFAKCYSSTSVCVACDFIS